MKTEELKAIGLTDDQIQRVFALNGADVNREKQAAATAVAERDTLRGQLADANKKLEGYDPAWQQKATAAQQAADEKIAALQAGYAAQNAAAGLKFSSESAKKAFLADLSAKKLPVQDGAPFAPDVKPPRFAAGTPGSPAQPTGREQANAAIRAVFGKE